MRSFKKSILLIALLLAIMLFVGGCTTNVYTRNLSYVCTLPIENQFHKDEETLVFEYIEGDFSHNEGEYVFVFVNTTISSNVDTDIFDQIKLLELNTIYQVSLVISIDDLYLCSISKVKTNE